MQQVCPICGYEVASLVGARFEQCPECGADVNAEAAKAALARRRRRRAVALITVAVVIPLLFLPALFLIRAAPPDPMLATGAVCLGVSWALLFVVFLRRRTHPSGSRLLGAISLATLDTALLWGVISSICLLATE